MRAGAARIEITPRASVWMDGMIRAHPSAGVHDPLFARALVLANNEDRNDAFVIVSVDVCALKEKDARIVRQTTADKVGIPAERIIIAATHTHSGPATVGLFNPVERDYVEALLGKLVTVIEEAANDTKTAMAGCGSGQEDTISHYRRLLTDDGLVVMNWEPYPTEHIMEPLGKIDPEIVVLKIVNVRNSDDLICLLFNHAGHPNIMSGNNYLLSAEYPGVTQRLLENEFEATSIFVNGAQGSVDIDSLTGRDWNEVERVGEVLTRAVGKTARSIVLSETASIHGGGIKYKIPLRRITSPELVWAEEVLKQTGRAKQTLADGVGDEFKARLYKKLRESEGGDVSVEQTCFAVGESAFISFPGELFTEIGVRIKAVSPFRHTYLIGLANGYVGYIPTRQAINEGGYAVDTRRLDTDAEDIIVEQSLTLLQEVHKL